MALTQTVEHLRADRAWNARTRPDGQSAGRPGQGRRRLALASAALLFGSPMAVALFLVFVIQPWTGATGGCGGG